MIVVPELLKKHLPGFICVGTMARIRAWKLIGNVDDMHGMDD